MRAAERTAHHRAGADDAADNQHDDPAQYDRDDDADCGIASGLFGGRLHRRRQAEIQQVDAVDATCDRDQPAESRHDLANAGYPTRRVGVRDRLQCLDLAFLAAERRRQCIDDQRHHVSQRQTQRIHHDHRGDAGADRRAVMDAECAVANQAALDETGNRGNRSQENDVVLVKIRHRRGLGCNHRPLGLRRHQDRFHPRDQVGHIHGPLRLLSMVVTAPAF